MAEQGSEPGPPDAAVRTAVYPSASQLSKGQREPHLATKKGVLGNSEKTKEGR